MKCDFCYVEKNLPSKYRKKRFCSQTCRLNYLTYKYLEDLKEANWKLQHKKFNGGH